MLHGRSGLLCRQWRAHPQGPGSNCTAAVACCFADGTCQDLDPLCCVDQGGSPLPAGSHCLGDNDVPPNGIDDACETGPDVCPLPAQPDVPWCENLQDTDCVNGAAGEECHPIAVKVFQGGVIRVDECDCLTLGGGCGGVEISGTNLICPGDCPVPPDDDVCQIHINGVATGAMSVDAADPTIPHGAVITCGCGSGG